MADDKELKDQRIPIMMTPSEVEAIDDWMFRKRIRSRGEAIRRLCQTGILANERLDATQEAAFRALKEVSDLTKQLEATVSAAKRDPDINQDDRWYVAADVVEGTLGAMAAVTAQLGRVFANVTMIGHGTRALHGEIIDKEMSVQIGALGDVVRRNVAKVVEQSVAKGILHRNAGDDLVEASQPTSPEETPTR